MSIKRSSKPQIPLFDVKLSSRAIREVRDVLKSGWLTAGPKVARLELQIAKFLGVRYATALNSGSAALLLTLRAMGASAGKQIITTPFTYVATIEAIVQSGAIPVMADIQPDTLNIAPDAVEAKLNRTTMAVLSVDMAGLPCDYKELRSVCAPKSIAMVADAAHAMGAEYGGRSMAQVADAAVYSFYSTKNLTCGEGGLLASRDREVVERVRALARHGLSSSTVERRKKSGARYDVLQIGYKASMSDVHAAIGLGQLTCFERDQAKRLKLARRYDKNLNGLTDLIALPARTDGRRHGWHMYIIHLCLESLKCDRDAIMQLMGSKGIECGVHFRPVFELEVYRRLLSLKERDYPHASAAGKRVLTLPLYPSLRLKDVDFICDHLNAILRANKK